jgi:hypothetical protein
LKIDLKVRNVSKEEETAFKQKKAYDGSNLIAQNTAEKSSANVTVEAIGTIGKSSLNGASTYATTSFTPYTVQCYATREGLVGGITANGHRITNTDVFVALPSNVALCSSDRDRTYTVNLSYNGRTMTNVPVWDIGPHNQYDDYWNVNYNTLPYPPYQYRVRSNWGYESYGDLPRGTSEAYMAFVNNFHNGWSSSHPLTSGSIIAYQSNSQPGSQYHGTLSNPSTNPNHLTKAEIDFSEGVWNTLGMTDNAFVTVTFNWVGQ